MEDEREGINRRVEIKKRSFCVGTSTLRFSALAATMKVWMFPMITLKFAKSAIDLVLHKIDCSIELDLMMNTVNKR